MRERTENSAPVCAETLSNIHGALAPGGFLLIYETTAAYTCCLWGLDERTWASRTSASTGCGSPSRAGPS